MVDDVKDIKTMAKDAKKRLKSGFWQSYKTDVVHFANKAKEEGVNCSKIVEFYQTKNSQQSISCSPKESFYFKVKKMLDEEGEVSDPIGRLIDNAVFESLSYTAKQKYLLELSESYRDAVERYRREQKLSVGIIANY